NQLEEDIWNRLNLCYNRIITKSPAEVFFNASFFENMRPRNEINNKHLKSIIIKHLNKNIKKENKNRILKRYSIGEKLFIKNISPDKVDANWIGPFEVIGYSKGENNVIIKKHNKIAKVPVKITRTFRGGENAAYLHHNTV
ncbi:hypothetical protein DMUE_3232, partial [Dictyocoela muelleri]